MNIQPSGSNALPGKYSEPTNAPANTNALKDRPYGGTNMHEGREGPDLKSQENKPQDTVSQMRRLRSVIAMEKNQVKRSKLDDMKMEYAKKRQDFIDGKGDTKLSLDDLERDYKDILRLEEGQEESSADQRQNALDGASALSDAAKDQSNDQKRADRDDKYQEHARLAREVNELGAKRDALRRDIESGNIDREEGIAKLEVTNGDIERKTRARDQAYREYGELWNEVHGLERPEPVAV